MTPDPLRDPPREVRDMPPAKDLSSIFEGHRCVRCGDGEKPCVQGHPNGCSWLQIRDTPREVREITGRGEWLAWRKIDVTASRVAALFDSHPHLTREQLAADMRSESSRGDSPAMRRGRILESAVAAAVSEERPEWALSKATTYHRLPDHRLGATPDYWINGDGLMQVKTVAPHEWENWGAHPPLAYTLQTLTELLVTGRAWGVLAVMVCSPSYPVHLFDVPRHPAAERRILDATAAWWKAWDAGEIAAPTPSDAIAAEVDDGSHIDLSRDNTLPALLDERAELKARLGADKKRGDEIDAEIRAKLGAARTAWLPGWLLKYPTIHAKEYTVAARDYRRLDVTRTKEEANAK